MRALTRLVTAAAVVVTYVAAMLAISAGIELRERNAFRNAPAQAAAFLAALDRGADVRAVDEWFAEHARFRSKARVSISLGADAAEDGRLDLARRYVADVTEEVAQDQQMLDQRFASSRATAVSWLAVALVLVVVMLVLRHRRRKANADVVELVSQFVPPRPVWRRPVFMVVSGIGYTLLVSGFLAGVAATRANEIPWDVRGFLLLGGVVSLVVAYFVLRYSRPRSVRGAAQALRADWRKPVLYLRSFGDDVEAAQVDALPVGLLSIHSREEQFVSALGAFGPVIAVGRPGEPLPHLGAARFYLPFDDWQPGVLRLMELSQLIVLRMGEGEGLRWELDQARATQPPAKLVLLMPGHDRWTSEVVVFDRDWTPRESPVGPFPGEKNQHGAPAFYVARAVQAALASIGVRKRALGYRINTRMLAAFGKVLLLIPGLFLAVFLLRLVFLW